MFTEKQDNFTVNNRYIKICVHRKETKSLIIINQLIN